MDGFPGASTVGQIGGAIGMGAGLNALFGGGPSMYQPQGMPQADQAWLQAMQGMGGLAQQGAGATQPVLSQSYQNMLGIDPSALAGAGAQAGQQYGALGGMGAGYSGALGQAGMGALGQQQNLYGAGQQAYQTGFDPQQALYQRTAQQLQDQVRAAESARGIAMSPYGGGLENQAMTNFNIDWQNQQLQRQLAGLGGMAGASGAGAQQGALGAGQLGQSYQFGQQVPQMTMAGAYAPIAGQEAVAQFPAQAAMQYAGQLQQGPGALYGGVGQMAQPYMQNAAQMQQNYYNALAAQRGGGLNALLTGMGMYGLAGGFGGGAAGAGAAGLGAGAGGLFGAGSAGDLALLAAG